MRSKTILSIAAFIVAFVLSTAFASLFITKSEPFSSIVVTPSYNAKKTSCFGKRGNKNRVAEKIETLVNQDKINGNQRAKRTYQINEDYRPSFSTASFPEYADAVSEYVNNSENLSYEDMPQEFQSAWLSHMKVWRDYSDFLNRMKSSSTRAKLGETKILELDSNYSDEINDTWYEVLRVGRTYGAEVY